MTAGEQKEYQDITIEWGWKVPSSTLFVKSEERNMRSGISTNPESSVGSKAQTLYRNALENVAVQYEYP